MKNQAMTVTSSECICLLAVTRVSLMEIELCPFCIIESGVTKTASAVIVAIGI